MSLIYSDNPDMDFMAYDAELALASRNAFPVCQKCGEEITDNNCYVMDDVNPREGCVCDSCMQKIIKMMPPVMEDYLDDALMKAWRETPVRER